MILKTAFSLILFNCLIAFGRIGSAASVCEDFLAADQDLQATLNSFEKMRGQNGLIQDTIWIQKKKDGRIEVKSLNSKTSPTNIAVDLLIQARLKNTATLQRILSTLSELPFHPSSGLFFSWYTTYLPTKAVLQDVSSVDNLHLALALWTVKENFPGQEFGKQAARLFERMNFSVFYDPVSGLVGGNLRHQRSRQGETWMREAYNFAHFGSEARILYSLGWALGLFKDFSQKPDFVKKVFSKLVIETAATAQGPVLRLWDGALFQLYFPKIFINEELYSTKMKEFYRNTAALVLAEGESRNLPVPAAHSPGRSSRFTYHDKSGLKTLVSLQNRDLNDSRYAEDWESLFTPYALFMASTSEPSLFHSVFERIRAFHSHGRGLYRQDVGWMDGLKVNAAGTRIIPAQLSLNQGMIALSLFQKKHPKGLSLSSETLYKNPRVRQRLQTFYRMFESTLGGS